jgi:hypothetical protein
MLYSVSLSSGNPRAHLEALARVGAWALFNKSFVDKYRKFVLKEKVMLTDLYSSSVRKILYNNQEEQSSGVHHTHCSRML